MIMVKKRKDYFKMKLERKKMSNGKRKMESHAERQGQNGGSGKGGENILATERIKEDEEEEY